ncbi:MAG: DUF503 domain-containing protein [Desulfuromonadales bacterium]|nr:MAG: DUF503 domain-containing protein [Desulfuromonadales bacterium]
MFMFSARFHIFLPADSLKGKRGIIKSIIARARQNFNVAGAEVDLQDVHGETVLAFVTVGQNRARTRHLLDRLEEWIVEARPDVEIVAAQIEEC